MNRLQTGFVLGYDGCEATVATDIVSGRAAMVPSGKPYDWLGNRIYFWEADPQRALEWAREKVVRGDYRAPAVVGAAIDLGDCLNLQSREAVELMRVAHDELAAEQRAAGRAMPENRSIGSDPDRERVLRFLDRAVVEHLNRTVRPFDTVRGLFSEGPDIYPGAGFKEKTHVQIAVRNPACIKGVFHPR